MKNIFLKLSYKTFSFLADKTNGWKVFVSPKLFFGALIIGITAVSANSCKKSDSEPEATCYDQAMEETLCYYAGPPAEIEEPFCYAPPAEIEEPFCYMPPASTTE